MRYSVIPGLKIIFVILCSVAWIPGSVSGQSNPVPLKLENAQVKFTVDVNGDRLGSDRMEMQSSWSKEFGAKLPPVIETDGDFAVEMMYTDWQAPGHVQNGENPVTLTKKDFAVVSRSTKDTPGGTKEFSIYLKARTTSLEMILTYRLNPDDFFVRRNIALMDTAFGHHFLRWVWVRTGDIAGVESVVKAGGFGQPIAFLLKNGGGGFFGLEYPTSENHLDLNTKSGYRLQCGQEFGLLIGSDWIQTEWVVEGITPNAFLKDWFLQYVDRIRVAPLKPYTLYNSWYDLRSPEYPKVPEENIMSEQSAIKMVNLLRNNMVEKHNIKLDAFVLDDGWDVYESDWVTRKAQWPKGFLPLSNELKKMGTSLGIWVGPTGGYSFRMKRVNWMREHGYEVVGKTRDNSMLCLAGKNYSELFKKRTTDFVANDGVGFFKWDGIQFSCSEPNHGHPVDIYSRRAVMESVIEKCKAVRDKDPSVFLNITSGTWLSPWWVKYANTIWMQGEDYGYSDVPSISKRDGAITYRDFILYDDFKNLDLWFPIANLMTHGIIKGKLEMLGSPEEPLDKFTDDALLYVARGISMYELYISPDIISDGEWNSMSAAITWARDRFPILTATNTMIGGNPMKREPYGYAHFKDKKGIVAARNPFITASSIELTLAVSQGLDPKASSLVIEKVYPTHWIAPKLYNAGEKITLPLDGYETAIYEIYPAADATVPLVGGVLFDIESSKREDYTLTYYNVSGGTLLNPSIIRGMMEKGDLVSVSTFKFKSEPVEPVVLGTSVKGDKVNSLKLLVDATVQSSVSVASLEVLLTPDENQQSKIKPSLSVLLDGKAGQVQSEDQEGKSQWHTIPVTEGKHTAEIEIKPGKDEKSWKGTATVYLVANQKQPSKEVTFVLKGEPKSHPLPPKVWNNGEIRKTVLLGTININHK